MAQWQGLGGYPENADPKDCPTAGELLAYVDGSYQDALKKYGFGCIFILPDGRIYTEYGNGDNPDSLKQRNVSVEMLGAMYAVRFALNSGFRAIEIRYDYEGIEKWVTGAWKSKNELTQSAPCRRNQPHLKQDPVCPFGSNGGEAGNGGRKNL